MKLGGGQHDWSPCWERLSGAQGKQTCPMRSALHAGGRGFESPRLHQPNKINGFRDSAPPEGPQKADAHPETGFQAALEAFLLSRRVSNCSPRSVEGYAGTIQRFATTLGIQELRDVTFLGIQRYLTCLSQTMKLVSVHHYFRPLKTFFRCVEADLLPENPTRGITIRIPRTLPRVPEDNDVRRLLQTCSQTFDGRRNRALIALLAESECVWVQALWPQPQRATAEALGGTGARSRSRAPRATPGSAT